MSRRARNRPDRRAVNFDGPAPDIEAAFAKLTAERVHRDEGGDEGDTITRRDGTTVDLRAPWVLPANLNGVHMANDPETYKRMAREALRA